MMQSITNIGVIIIIAFASFSNTIILPAECDSSSPPLAPALYIFGDSIVDNGNNNRLITIAKANYPPYGHNFAKGPTGRFTNGKTIADFTAEYLGLPYPPPYERLLQPDSITGYNYASGSCGILPETGRKYGYCLSLDEQIRKFGATVRSVLTPNLQSRISQYMAKSVFVFVVGSNDYLGNYFNSSSNANQSYNRSQFAQLLLDSLSLNLQKLYQLGARKVLVSEIGPLGCTPTIVTSSKPNGKCDEDKNDMVSIYNNQLPWMLNNLTSTLNDLHFVLIKSYDFAYDAVHNPANYGFSDSTSSCCKTLGKVPLCIVATQPCAEPDTHFFWDDVHPSEAAYSIAANDFIHGSSPGRYPMNLDQLLQL